MPNRILRDWTDSPPFEGISAEGERLFARLIMKADDFGRFHADPRLVRAACFPLSEHLRATEVAAWLTELSDRRLILRYEVGTRSLLAIFNFGQRLKQSRPKFPPPAGKPPDFLALAGRFRELPGSSGKFPPESETDSETESEAETTTTPPAPPPPAPPSSAPPATPCRAGGSGTGRRPANVEEVVAVGAICGLPEADCRDWFRDMELAEWRKMDGTPFGNWKRELTVHRDRLREGNHGTRKRPSLKGPSLNDGTANAAVVGKYGKAGVIRL